MYKEINIKNKKQSLALLSHYQKKKTVLIDIKFINTNLKEINNLIGKAIFVKNDLYVNSDTLYEIMQPIGGRGRHNFHGLTPEEIINVLNNLIHPYCVYKANKGKYGIISTITRATGETFIIIIEIGAGLIGRMDANINKFVTMFPKTEIGKFIARANEILYLKI